MAVLVDCAQKASRLLQQALSLQGAYEAARDAYDRLDTNQPLNTEGLTMLFQIGDQPVPVEVPQDREVLQSYLLASINFFAGQLGMVWAELHGTTAAATSHINNAAARADESVVSAPPAIAAFPQIQPQLPQQSPVQQPPFRQSPPMTPPRSGHGLPAAIQLPMSPPGVHIPTVPVS